VTLRSTEPRTSRVPRRLLRFDRVERATHWANALLFGILIATALPLYFPAIESAVGRRSLVAEIHLYAGIALPVPLLLALIGPWGARLRADLRRVNVWTTEEIQWLRTLGRLGSDALDKFNPGQKLNAIFTGGVIAVMFASGVVMHSINLFPLDWRTGATFVHDVLAFAAVAVIVGHIGFAVTHPDAMKSMFTGSIDRAWAKRHAPAWVDEDPEPSAE
jgi:formate dehydrogenase subunit gamma